MKLSIFTAITVIYNELMQKKCKNKFILLIFTAITVIYN